MKKYHSIIKLIVVTAGLVGLGVVAFKYLHNKNDNVVKIQASPIYATLSGSKQGKISSNGQTQGSFTPTGSNLKMAAQGSGYFVRPPK
jgi:flagellar hook protein FlgE